MTEAEGLTCGKGLDVPHPWKQQFTMKERRSHEKKVRCIKVIANQDEHTHIYLS